MPLSPSELLEKIVGNYDFKAAFQRIDANLIRMATHQGTLKFSVPLEPLTPNVVLDQIIAAYKEKGWAKVYTERHSGNQHDGASLYINFEA